MENSDRGKHGWKLERRNREKATDCRRDARGRANFSNRDVFQQRTSDWAHQI